MVLSAAEGLTIRYTLDGSEPTRSRVPSSITRGAVYAASEDGSDDFIQSWPSPGASNGTAAVPVEEPLFLTPGGFYQDSVEVVLSSADGLVIRYTLDGSEPTADSPLYEEPLVLSDPSASENIYSSREDITSPDRNYQAPQDTVDKAAIVRAAAFDSEGNRSAVVTSTYFIGFDEKEGYENASCSPWSQTRTTCFSSETGIYVRGSLYEEALENGEIYEGLPWSMLLDYTQYSLRGYRLSSVPPMWSCILPGATPS